MKRGLIGLFIFVVMIGSLVMVYAQLAQQSTLNKEIANCEGMRTDREICYYNLGIKFENADFCKIAGDLREMCYSKVALMTNLSHLCESTGGWQGNCYADLAIRNDNIKLCEQASAAVYRENCYSTIAVTQKNVTVCNALPGNNWFNLFGLFKSQKTKCLDAVRAA